RPLWPIRSGSLDGDMTSLVLAHRVLPRTRINTTVLVVAVAALTALAAQVRIPLWPVPITGSTFAVLLGGAALGWKAGGTAQLLYLVVGIAGVPVFADGNSGAATLIGPTGGYLLAFPVAAALVGWLAGKGHDRRFHTMAFAFLAGSAVIYMGGVTGLMLNLGMTLPAAMSAGVYPFLIGDAIKATGAGLLLPAIWRRL